MVKITIELNELTHENLKNRASKNLRSMRNELVIIVSEALNNDITSNNDIIKLNKIHI